MKNTVFLPVADTIGSFCIVRIISDTFDYNITMLSQIDDHMEYYHQFNGDVSGD